MRGDMPKIIVERPRRGEGTLRKGKALRDDELALSKVGMKRGARLRGGYKALNENLAPLKRFLNAQVDRPWDKVWSEICANLKPSNTVQQHVRDHIPDFVAIKTRLKDGEVWVHERFSPVRLKDSYVRLYVDPKIGILRRNKYWRSWEGRRRDKREAEAKERDARMRVVSEKVQLHLFNECWWEVRLAKVPTGVQQLKSPAGTRQIKVELAVDDALLHESGDALSRQRLYGKSGVYGVSKRQLSKKEIRALKLR
jgi:hypothetical protein